MMKAWPLIFLVLSTQRAWGQKLESWFKPSREEYQTCPRPILQGESDSSITSQIKSAYSAASELGCSKIDAKGFSRYSPVNCQLLINCSAYRFNQSTPSLEYASFVGTKLGEDYAEMMLSDRMKEMENVETLKRYAEKNFKEIIPKNCGTKFDYNFNSSDDQKSCRARLMDEGFTRIQNKCRDGLDDKKKCITFDTKASLSQGESKIQHHFSGKIEASLKNISRGEDEATKEIIGIMTLKVGKEEKLKKFFEKLNDLRNRGLLDPALSFGEYNYYDRDHLDLSAHFKFFSNLFSKPALKENEAKEQFINYRRGYAKEQLTKSCQEIPSFMDICRKATDASRFKKVFVEKRESAEAISTTKSDKDIETLKKALHGVIGGQEDYELFMDAKRCESFSFDFTRDSDRNGHYSGIVSSIADHDQEKISSLADYNYVDPNSVFSNSTQSKGVTVQAATSSTSSSNANDREPSSEISDEDKSDNAPQAPQSEATSNVFSDFEAKQQKAFQESQSSFPISNNNFVSPSTPEAKPLEPSTDKQSPAEIGGSSALNDKISELTKRLNTAEENLEKMKAEKVQTDKEKEQEEKLAAEKEKVAELSKQLEEVKAQAKKSKAKTEAEGKMASLPAGNGAKSSPPSSQDRGFQNQNASSSNLRSSPQDSLPSEMTQSSAQSLTRSLPAISPSTAASSSSPVVAASAESSAPRIVLSGLSAEKAAEIISAKILAMPTASLLNGAVLDIEEGGVWKQIIPIVVDGKVQLDDKGQPMYQKIVRKKGAQMAAKTRAPASIDSAADLKRIDEERVKKEKSRAEYLKLKKVTAQARDKK